MNNKSICDTTDKTLFMDEFVDDSVTMTMDDIEKILIYHSKDRESERVRSINWRKTEEYKQWRKEYISSEEYKQKRKEYDNSEHRIAWKKQYQSTKDYKSKTNLRNKNRRERLWNLVLEIYGSKCVCCGESNKNFLTLDHINGGGSKERTGSTTTLQKAVEEKDKTKYQILCYNCNTGRHWNGGICPHVEEKPLKNSLRIKFIEEYGGRCECCGETIKTFLTLDHVNGRKKEEPKTPYKEAVSFKDNNKYRILCCNCNAGRQHRGINGTCPHKITSEEY
jgi:hypothetical protein